MITKEKFIKDMKSILNNIDCSETNGYISAESHWYAEMVIEQLIEDVCFYAKQCTRPSH